MKSSISRIVVFSGILFMINSFYFVTFAQTKNEGEPYVLGPSDVMEITAAPGGDQSQAITRTVTVRPDGYISFDYVGAIYVNGLTPEQVDVILTKKIKEFVKDVEVSVQVTEFNAMRVFVVGEVTTPGEFTLATKMTVLDAISLAGSYTANASLKKVKVVRPSRERPTIIVLNMKKFIHNGDARYNIYLQDGDVVVVSPDGWAKLGYTFGKIIHPFRDVVSLLVAYVIISSMWEK